MSPPIVTSPSYSMLLCARRLAGQHRWKSQPHPSSHRRATPVSSARPPPSKRKRSRRIFAAHSRPTSMSRRCQEVYFNQKVIASDTLASSFSIGATFRSTKLSTDASVHADFFAWLLLTGSQLRLGSSSLRPDSPCCSKTPSCSVHTFAETAGTQACVHFCCNAPKLSIVILEILFILNPSLANQSSFGKENRFIKTRELRSFHGAEQSGKRSIHKGIFFLLRHTIF